MQFDNGLIMGMEDKVNRWLNKVLGSVALLAFISVFGTFIILVIFVMLKLC